VLPVAMCRLKRRMRRITLHLRQVPAEGEIWVAARLRMARVQGHTEKLECSNYRCRQSPPSVEEASLA
jgi:hypothetical protein